MLERSFYHRMSDEDQKKLDHMSEKQSLNDQKLKSSLIGNMSALNDGVIAIFITVMMLSIPFPQTQSEYQSFINAIIVFLISFFVIAEFWYENKKVFQSMKEADKPVILMNFVFLACLALIPVTTAWILHDPSMFAVVNYGVVYLLTVLSNSILYFVIVRKRFRNHVGLLVRLFFRRIGMIAVINAILIGIAYIHPELAMYLYLLLPLIEFVTPNGSPSGVSARKVKNNE